MQHCDCDGLNTDTENAHDHSRTDDLKQIYDPTEPMVNITFTFWSEDQVLQKADVKVCELQ